MLFEDSNYDFLENCADIHSFVSHTKIDAIDWMNICRKDFPIYHFHCIKDYQNSVSCRAVGICPLDCRLSYLHLTILNCQHLSVRNLLTRGAVLLRNVQICLLKR